MALASCPRCDKMFNKSEILVCPECEPSETDDYERVREALQGNPEMSAEKLAEFSGVDIKCISRFLESGRIETTLANQSVVCGRCGAPAISLSKRLCESCLHKLNTELMAQQSDIQLTQKRQVEVGGGGKKGDASGGVKYQR